jgi:DNA-binding transcriptional MerR regulator
MNDPAETDATGANAMGAARKGRKSASAYRTISEVADDLHVPQHVLRFWETKFPQIRPLKRGGGRRYYRPEDILLLRRIGDLLYIQGYTIKGVQRLLREGGAEGGAAGELDPAEAEAPEPPAEPAAPPAMAVPERSQLDLLGAPAVTHAAAKPVVRVRAESSARPPVPPPPVEVPVPETSHEVARLRALLQDAQDELAAIRGLLERAAS